MAIDTPAAEQRVTFRDTVRVLLIHLVNNLLLTTVALGFVFAFRGAVG